MKKQIKKTLAKLIAIMLIITPILNINNQISYASRDLYTLINGLYKDTNGLCENFSNAAKAISESYTQNTALMTKIIEIPGIKDSDFFKSYSLFSGKLYKLDEIYQKRLIEYNKVLQEYLGLVKRSMNASYSQEKAIFSEIRSIEDTVQKLNSLEMISAAYRIKNTVITLDAAVNSNPKKAQFGLDSFSQYPSFEELANSEKDTEVAEIFKILGENEKTLIEEIKKLIQNPPQINKSGNQTTPQPQSTPNQNQSYFKTSLPNVVKAIEIKNPKRAILAVKFKINSNVMEIANLQESHQFKMDAAPIITSSRTMVPLRYAAEALGLQIGWDQNTKSAILRNNKHTITVPTTQNKIIVDNKEYTTDVKPVLKGGRTYLSISNLAIAMGLNKDEIFWNGPTKEVIIIRDTLD